MYQWVFGLLFDEIRRSNGNPAQIRPPSINTIRDPTESNLGRTVRGPYVGSLLEAHIGVARPFRAEVPEGGEPCEQVRLEVIRGAADPQRLGLLEDLILPRLLTVSMKQEMRVGVDQAWQQRRVRQFDQPRPLRCLDIRFRPCRMDLLALDDDPSLMGLVSGSNGFYPYMPEADHAAALQALGNHMSALTSADAHFHGQELAANAQMHDANTRYQPDPHRNPAYQQAVVAHLQAQAKNLNSEADARDPSRTLDMMRQIANDPTLRNYDLKRQGVSQAEIDAVPFPIPGQPAASPAGGTQPTPGVAGPPAAPRPAIHTGNVDQALTNPQLGGLRTVLAEPNLDFHQKVARASAMDGFDDPNHPTRQAFNAWLHQQFPTRQDWQKHIESYPAIGPDQWRARAFGFDWPGKETIGGPMMSIISGLTGQGFTGTGWGWRQNYDNGQQLFDALAKHNIQY